MEPDHAICMQRGAQLHAAGRVEEALLAFEHALAMQPQDVNTASACAAMLSLLSRPRAAYNNLCSVKTALLKTADGAANLAIAAEGCGEIDEAQNAYQCALELDPEHLRALNNVGLLAASRSQWDVAILCAEKCVLLDPAQPAHHAHLSDAFCGARQYARAIEVVNAARLRFPEDPALTTRQIVALAFQGDLEKAKLAMAALDAAGRQHLQGFLRNWASQSSAQREDAEPSTLPDPAQLYRVQAFEAMAVCDWRDQQALTAKLRKLLADDVSEGKHSDWNDTCFYGQMLDLQEEELSQMDNSLSRTKASLKGQLPPFVHRRGLSKSRENRIHIGLEVPDLRDQRLTLTLKRQLALYDASRFVFHVYSSTPCPEPGYTEQLLTHASTVVEIAHMTATEAASRVRLDRLDLFIETAFATSRGPNLAAYRVAPLQLRQPAWHRRQMPGTYDYIVSDTWIHPNSPSFSAWGCIARLPATCWLATGSEKQETGLLSREECGLPDDRLVLSSFLAPIHLDPHSFATWMKILRSLPDALLWLPAYVPLAASHLTREAEAAGVNPNRLLFATPATHTTGLAALSHTDLFLDTLRFNAGDGLAAALQLGVPSITCSGDSLASRMGGSIVRAAGLPECVVDSPEAYVTEAVRLGRDQAALQLLRQRLQTARLSAPLFDTSARIKEWEAAFTTMVERSRAGLPPAAFDVPASSHGHTGSTEPRMPDGRLPT
jgi:protein O-GlcNAc transferase